MNPVTAFASIFASTTQQAGKPQAEKRSFDFMITDDREAVESVPTKFLARRLDGANNAYVNLSSIDNQAGGQGLYTEFANEYPFNRVSYGVEPNTYKFEKNSNGGQAQT